MLMQAWLWQDDVPFYLLNTLPEMAALVCVTWPTLLARSAQRYPMALESPPSRHNSVKMHDKHAFPGPHTLKSGIARGFRKGGLAFSHLGTNKHATKDAEGYLENV